MTTLAIADKMPEKSTNTDEPPHKLLGEEILDREDKEKCKPRAQSARPVRCLTGEGSTDSSIARNRPKTAVEKDRGGYRPITLSNVERWLSSSYQNL